MKTDITIKLPQLLYKKISDNAPVQTISDGWERGRSNVFGDDIYEESSRAYKNVLFYVQIGLAEEIEIIKKIVDLVLRVQQNSGIKWYLIPTSFGDNTELIYEKKYFEMGYMTDTMNINVIVKVLARLSGKNKIKENAVIPDLIPRKNGKCILRGKSRIDNNDLLVIIGEEGKVYFNQELKNHLKLSIRKHILFVSFGKDEIKYYFGKNLPQFFGFDNNENIRK